MAALATVSPPLAPPRRIARSRRRIERREVDVQCLNKPCTFPYPLYVQQRKGGGQMSHCPTPRASESLGMASAGVRL